MDSRGGNGGGGKRWTATLLFADPKVGGGNEKVGRVVYWNCWSAFRLKSGGISRTFPAAGPPPNMVLR